MPDPVKKTVVKRKNRTTSVKNADGTTTKTRVRRDGSTKKVKTYKGNKTVASKVVKFRKDGTKKKVVTRPGDKTGTVVKTVNKQGKKTGSFNKKKDSSPYLEVHHIHLLAEGGDDSVDNARALCPNCHRKAHHGEIPNPFLHSDTNQDKE